jgi:hypothetical protein
MMVLICKEIKVAGYVCSRYNFEEKEKSIKSSYGKAMLCVCL